MVTMGVHSIYLCHVNFYLYMVNDSAYLFPTSSTLFFILNLSSVSGGLGAASHFSTSMIRLMTLFYKTCQITPPAAFSISERGFLR